LENWQISFLPPLSERGGAFLQSHRLDEQEPKVEKERRDTIFLVVELSVLVLSTVSVMTIK
jgi:hypothetical protein